MPLRGSRPARNCARIGVQRSVVTLREPYRVALRRVEYETDHTRPRPLKPMAACCECAEAHLPVPTVGNGNGCPTIVRVVRSCRREVRPRHAIIVGSRDESINAPCTASATDRYAQPRSPKLVRTRRVGRAALCFATARTAARDLPLLAVVACRETLGGPAFLRCGGQARDGVDEFLAPALGIGDAVAAQRSGFEQAFQPVVGVRQ